MKKDNLALLTGIIVGFLLGIFLNDTKKQQIRNSLQRYARKLRSYIHTPDVQNVTSQKDTDKMKNLAQKQ